MTFAEGGWAVGDDINCQTPLIDTWARWTTFDRPRLLSYYDDSIHPVPAGYMEDAYYLAKVLTSLSPDEQTRFVGYESANGLQVTLSFVGISISSSTSSPIAATLPSGATTGDLAFRHWVGYGNNATPPAVADPSGWNRLSRAVLDSSYGLTVPNQTWENVIWWRYLDGTADDTATVTKDSVQSVHQEDIAVYRGLADGCRASNLSISATSGGTWTPTPPSPIRSADVVFAYQQQRIPRRRRPPTTTAGAVLVASHLRDHPDTRELTTNG